MTGARGDFSKGYMCRYRTICILVSVNNHTSASSKNRRPISTWVPWCKMDKLTTECLLRDGNPYCWDPNSQTPLKSVCRMTDQTRTQFRWWLNMLCWSVSCYWADISVYFGYWKKKSLACVRTRTSASGGPSLSNLQKQYFSGKTSDMEWYLCTELITNTVIND